MKKLREESVKLCFLITLDIIISYTFPENLIEIQHVSKDMNFYFFDLNYFCQFFRFFTINCYEKLMTSASIGKYLQFFGLELFSIVCLGIVLSYINIGLTFLPKWRLASHTNPPRINYLQKSSLRGIKLK